MYVRTSNVVTGANVCKRSTWMVGSRIPQNHPCLQECSLNHLAKVMKPQLLPYHNYQKMWKESNIPSWEWTYPIPGHVWRWFSFSQGGLCYSSFLEGISNQTCTSTVNLDGPFLAIFIALIARQPGLGHLKSRALSAHTSFQLTLAETNVESITPLKINMLNRKITHLQRKIILENLRYSVPCQLSKV